MFLESLPLHSHACGCVLTVFISLLPSVVFLIFLKRKNKRNKHFSIQCIVCHVCKLNSVLISGSIPCKVPILAGQYGFRMQWSSSSLCMSSQEEEKEPPRAVCLAEFSSSSSIKADLLQTVGNWSCFPHKMGTLSLYGLSPPPVSLSSNSWRLRHNIHPRKRRDILERTYWSLCRVRSLIMYGQGDKYGAQTLSVISVNSLPCKTVHSHNEIPALKNCPVHLKWLFEFPSKFFSSISCIWYLNTWWLEIQRGKITLSKNIPREVPHLFTLREFSFELYFVE